MLFLAVFLGFIAENAREHFIEKEKGKGYLESLYQDVKKDTANLTITIQWFEDCQGRFDTLLDHFDEMKDGSSAAFGRNLFILGTYQDFVYTDRTMQQLKNAGGLRLITDKETVDSIINYDACIRLQQIQLEAIDDEQTKMVNIREGIFDFQKVMTLRPWLRTEKENRKTDWLLTHDKRVLGSFYNAILYYEGVQKQYLRLLKNSRETGGTLVAFLQDKYHFK